MPWPDGAGTCLLVTGGNSGGLGNKFVCNVPFYTKKVSSC